MGTVTKLRPKIYKAKQLISDLVLDQDSIAHILAIWIDTDGNVHISGSRMTNAQVCMLAHVAHVNATEAITEGFYGD